MATKTVHRELSEAELNAPDLDDEGNLDVEHYPIPDGSTIRNPELRAAWDGAMKILNGEADAEESKENEGDV